MKKWLLLVVSILVITSSKAESPYLKKMSFFDSLNEAYPAGNLVVCLDALLEVFQFLHHGVQAKSKGELETVFGFGTEQFKSSNKRFTQHILAASKNIFFEKKYTRWLIREGIDLRLFNANDLCKGVFCDDINKKLERHNQLKRAPRLMLDDDKVGLAGNTISFLCAAHIHKNWLSKFKRLRECKPFYYTSNEKTNTDVVFTTLTSRYLYKEGSQAIVLPFAASSSIRSRLFNIAFMCCAGCCRKPAKMVIVMPAANSALEKGWLGDIVKEVFDEPPYKVHLEIPYMSKIVGNTDCSPILEEKSLAQLTRNFCFSPVVGSPKVSLNLIKQSVVISFGGIVNNTEYSVVSSDYGPTRNGKEPTVTLAEHDSLTTGEACDQITQGYKQQPISLQINRRFFFFIFDGRAKLIFGARIDDPNAGSVETYHKGLSGY